MTVACESGVGLLIACGERGRVLEVVLRQVER